MNTQYKRGGDAPRICRPIAHQSNGNEGTTPHRLMSESILPKATAPRLTLTSATLNGIPYGDKNLSQVFTSHLKTRGWSQQDAQAAYSHVCPYLLHVCMPYHQPSPFEILGKKMVIIFEIVQLFLLVIGIACWLTMCYVNASWAVTRRIFKKCANIHLLVLADTLFSDRIIEREDSVRFSTGIP